MGQHISTLRRSFGAIAALALLASPGRAAPTGAELSRATPENTRAACTDHLDNDMDGHEDCDDQDCQDLVICSREKPVATLSPAPSSPERYLKRRRATMRIVAGSIMMACGVVLPAISGVTWWRYAGRNQYDENAGKGLLAGSLILDVGGVGLIAAGATFLTLGAGDAAALKYSSVPRVGVSF